MNVTMRREVERRIAAALIRDGLATDYSISVNNGGEDDEIPPSTDRKTIMRAMFATDDEHLIFWKGEKRVGWVWFVYGNDGWDCISDYTSNLEHIMAGANEVSERLLLQQTFGPGTLSPVYLADQSKH